MRATFAALAVFAGVTCVNAAQAQVASSQVSSQAARSRATRSLGIAFGFGRLPSTEGAVRGPAYALDARFHWRLATLNVSCGQLVGGNGLEGTRVRNWVTTCGAAAGVGYESEGFFIAAEAGADLAFQAVVTQFGGTRARQWAVYGLARLQVHAHYRLGRWLIGTTLRVRLGRLGRRDARYFLSAALRL